jgi:hypothetical protein
MPFFVFGGKLAGQVLGPEDIGYPGCHFKPPVFKNTSPWELEIRSRITGK